MASVELTKLAEDDLVDIWKYIADDNPTAATRTVEAIYERIEQLSLQPHMGRNRSDLREGLQSHSLSNYIIFFFAKNRPKGVQVVRILEGHRDIGSEVFEE